MRKLSVVLLLVMLLVAGAVALPRPARAVEPTCIGIVLNNAPVWNSPSWPMYRIGVVTQGDVLFFVTQATYSMYHFDGTFAQPALSGYVSTGAVRLKCTLPPGTR